MDSHTQTERVANILVQNLPCMTILLLFMSVASDITFTSVRVHWLSTVWFLDQY